MKDLHLYIYNAYFCQEWVTVGFSSLESYSLIGDISAVWWLNMMLVSENLSQV